MLTFAQSLKHTYNESLRWREKEEEMSREDEPNKAWEKCQKQAMKERDTHAISIKREKRL